MQVRGGDDGPEQILRITAAAGFLLGRARLPPGSRNSLAGEKIGAAQPHYSCGDGCDSAAASRRDSGRLRRPCSEDATNLASPATGSTRSRSGGLKLGEHGEGPSCATAGDGDEDGCHEVDEHGGGAVRTAFGHLLRQRPSSSARRQQSSLACGDGDGHLGGRAAFL